MKPGGSRAWPLLCLLAVVLVAAGALSRLAGWDTPLMLWVHAGAPSAASAIFWSCATIVGLGWAALILVLAADRGAGRGTALLLPTFVLGALLAHVPKALFGAPRPAGTAILPHLHVIGDTFTGPVSMPSGHAVTAGATAALLCVLLPAGRRWLGVLLLAAGAVVAWSRVVVGAHWPSDVLVGSGLGLLAVAVVLAVARWQRTRALFERFAGAVRTRAGQHTVAVLEVLAAVGLLKERTGYPDGRAMVVLLATVAVLSAVWRWQAARGARAARRADAAPVEPT